MMTIGRIEPFEEKEGIWDQYQERLQQYFITTDVADDKRVPVTLSLIERKTYALLRSLCAPNKPSQKTFAQLCTLKPLVIAERFRFFKRQQAVGESVSEYCAVLQKLSETCDFGVNLEDSLRD